MPSFYILLGLFLMSVGLYTWFFHAQDSFFDIERVFPASLGAIYWGLAIFAPILSTGVIMEEKKTNMFKVLLVKPISVRKIVVGKLGAIVVVLAIFLVLSSLHYLSILSISAINFHYVARNYLFLCLLGIAYASISMSVASFFYHYWKSYLFSYLIIFFVHFFANLLGSLSIAEVQIIFNYIGLYAHFDYFLSGGFALSTCVYLLSITTIGTAITIYKLGRDNS